MNKYIILIKNVHQIAPFAGNISNFLHVWGGTSPSETPPFEGWIQVTGKKQNYWKNGNEQEVHLFSLKKAFKVI